MGKRSRRQGRLQALALAGQTASMKPEISPDVTLGPEDSLASTREQWMGSDSTSVPDIGEPDHEASYARGGAQFIEKLLQGRMPLVPRAVFLLITLAWFVFVSFLFTKDNELGRLDTAKGMKWFGFKIGAYSLMYILVGLVVLILSRAFRPSKSPSD